MLTCIKLLEERRLCADDYQRLQHIANDIERKIWNLQDADMLMRRPFVLESRRYDD